MTTPHRKINGARFDVAAHQPTRPGWQCQTDNEDFPCSALREYVLETFRSEQDRALYMSGYWQFAIVELPKPAKAGAIHRRFFGWIRAAAEPQPVRGRPPGGF
jgi:hypothetical protein